VPTVSSLTESVELGDDPTQLWQVVDPKKARLHRFQEEKDHATEALKKEKEDILDKLWTEKKEKDDLREMFDEEKEKIKKEKYQQLTEQIAVKEAVTRALHSMLSLA